MFDIVIMLMPNTQLSNPTMYYPIGALIMSTVYKKLGLDVKVIDFRMGIDYNKLPTAKHIAFSCTTPEVVPAMELSRRYRNAGVHTIVGGPHATLDYKSCEKHFDTVVVGEGEEVGFKSLQMMGVIQARRILNLDGIIPDWSALDNPFSQELMLGERYGKSEPAATIIGSRGCSFKCSFCGNMLNTPVVFRTVDSIIEELSILKNKHRVSQIRFEDDNLTIHPKLEELCKRISDLHIKFKGHTRSHLISNDNVSLLKSAGLVEMGLGVESADDKVLIAVKKKESVADHIKAIKILKSNGIIVKTYFMSGLPSETEQTIKLNMDFFDKYKPDKWTLSRFTPYVGCDIRMNPSKYGVKILDWDLAHYWNFPDRSTYCLNDASVSVLDERYKILYNYLVSEEWKR